MPTAVVILPSTTYRATDFIEAAEHLGVDLIVASENPPPLDMGDRYLQIDCSNPGAAASSIVSLGDRTRIDGVVAADDSGVEVAAIAAQKLGLRGNSPAAARATRDKATQRRLLAKAEVAQPAFELISGDDPDAPGLGLRYPLVVKPLDRSASQGVVRVDGIDQLRGTIEEVRDIVGSRKALIAEEFMIGDEVALEGIVADGALTTLTIFDKPGASTGPAFQELILVSPSSLNGSQQAEVERVAASAIRAIGITNGPVHVEMKVDGPRVAIIEVAARSIGGLCSHTLDFGLMGTTLETLILRNAIGLDKPGLRRSARASGVLMIPIPRAGRFVGIANLDEIRAFQHVTGVEITVPHRAWIAPPPVGDRYLGFVFARASSPADVTDTLIAIRDLVEVEVA